MNQLVCLPQPGAQILAARLVVPLGSHLDPPGRAGQQQLLAGVLTRGCGSLDAEAFADLVEGLGANLRCEAGDDLLVVALKCARADASTLLPLLLQMLEQPQCASSQVGLERDLNLQALQRLQEDPFHLCHEQLRQQLFGNGPYGHDPLGLAPQLASIKPDQLKQAALHLPQACAQLVVAGDPEASLLERCQARFGQWSAAAMPEQSVAPNPARSLALLAADTEQAVLMLGFRTVGLAHGDALPLRLLQVHLGVGMSSRLFQVMREELGLAYDVGTDLPARRRDSPFVWHLSTGAERLPEAMDALYGEWQALHQAPLAEAALALAKAKLRGQEALGRETGSQRADRLALLLSHGLPADHNERALERLASIGPEQVQAVAQRWLVEPSLSVCGPASALVKAQKRWDQCWVQAPAPVL